MKKHFRTFPLNDSKYFFKLTENPPTDFLLVIKKVKNNFFFTFYLWLLKFKKRTSLQLSALDLL